MRFRSVLLASLVASPLLAAACAAPAAHDDASGGVDAITSNDGKVLDFAFHGEVTASSDDAARTAVIGQLQYVQGILTTNERGNGHIGHVQLANVRESASGDQKTIAYDAVLPVIWPKDGNAIPTTYDLPLPKDVTKLDAFNRKYDGTCGKNEYGQETFWHDWNPKAEGCRIDDADVVKLKATIKPSASATQDKYPEYDQMFADGELDAVAIFGLIDGTTFSENDPGVAEYRSFVNGIRSRVSGADVKENEKSDSILLDTTITGNVTVGGQTQKAKIDVILVAEMQSVGSDFDSRYDAISEKADLIMYDGHAGLGKNVNALARKGKVAKNKYQLILLNGCQTFAYIDTTLNDRRIEANGAAADPKGTRYMDVIGNALPGYTNNLSDMSLKLFDASVGSNKSFNTILEGFPQIHLVAVFGEEDNKFKP